MCLYFLRAIGTAMSMQDGTAADAAAALLFRILSQPDLLFPMAELRPDCLGSLAESDQVLHLLFKLPMKKKFMHSILT